MIFGHASKTTTVQNKFISRSREMWQSVEIASHIHKLRERLESCSFAKQKHLKFSIYLYITKMGESTFKFDFGRIVPVFFARTFPFDFLRESSRSNRPREELVFARNVP